MKRCIYPFSFSVILSVLTIVAKGQVVNIESARMQSDTTGWMGSINAYLGFSQNTNHVFNTDLGAHLQYKTLKDLWLILAEYQYMKAGSTKFTDNSFVHLRYNHKLNAWLRWEIFFQAQNNLITQMRSRILLGTGPRFKICSTKVFRLYAASLAMYEQEKENTNPFIRHKDLRSSSYISFTIIPSKTVEIISTTYYQPLFKKFSDYRILNQAVLKVKANKHFSVSLKWNYLYDSYPAGTAPKTTYSFSGGAGYEF